MSPTRVPPPARGHPVARVAAVGEKDVDDIMAEANELLNAVAGGKAPAPAGVQESIDGLTAAGFVCDESGCVLVLPQESEDEGTPTLATLLQGEGWRLGVVERPDDIDYPALVSGAAWAVPLSRSELEDLQAVLQRLRATVEDLHRKGQWLPAAGERPASRAKWQSHNITMRATWAAGGRQPAFSVDMTLNIDRRPVDAAWPAEAAAGVCGSLDAALAANGRG